VRLRLDVQGDEHQPLADLTLGIDLCAIHRLAVAQLTLVRCRHGASRRSTPARHLCSPGLLDDAAQAGQGGRAGGHHGAPYIGSAVGRQDGVTAEKLLALGEYSTSPLFSEVERTCLAYADAMTRTPVDVPTELFERLRASFSEAQLVELTASIAWENYRARFDHAFGMESEEFSEGAACAVPVRALPPAGSNPPL
jgi:hypothetical protein